MRTFKKTAIALISLLISFCTTTDLQARRYDGRVLIMNPTTHAVEYTITRLNDGGKVVRGYVDRNDIRYLSDDETLYTLNYDEHDTKGIVKVCRGSNVIYTLDYSDGPMLLLWDGYLESIKARKSGQSRKFISGYIPYNKTNLEPLFSYEYAN